MVGRERTALAFCLVLVACRTESPNADADRRSISDRPDASRRDDTTGDVDGALPGTDRLDRGVVDEPGTDASAGVECEPEGTWNFYGPETKHFTVTVHPRVGEGERSVATTLISPRIDSCGRCDPGPDVLEFVAPCRVRMALMSNERLVADGEDEYAECGATAEAEFEFDATEYATGWVRGADLRNCEETFSYGCGSPRST